MQTLKRPKKQPVTGSTMWHNPTPGRVTIKIGNGQSVVFEPGDTMPLPIGTNVSRKAPQLEAVVSEMETTEPEPEAKPKKRSRRKKNTLPADLPPVQARLGDDGKDSGRSAGDAIEDLARGMVEDNDIAALRQMAKDLALSENGSALDVARRLAKDAAGA